MQGDQRLSVPYSAHVSAHIRDQVIIIRQSVILSPGSDARLIKGDARYILMYKDQYLIFEERHARDGVVLSALAMHLHATPSVPIRVALSTNP